MTLTANVAGREQFVYVVAFKEKDYRDYALYMGICGGCEFDDVVETEIKSIDSEITAKNEIIIAEKKIWNKAINGAAISDAEKDAIFSDMRILLKVIVGDPVKEFKNYNSYNCPFHDDKSPSARVYKNNFLCATENLHLNSFDAIL